MKIFLTTLLMLISSTTIAQPAATKATTAPTEIKLALQPAKITRPSLRYRLLPDPVDLAPGNAAFLYLVAIQLQPVQEMKAHNDELEQMADWTTMSFDKLPRDKATALLERYQATLGQLGLAARRKECHWDLPFEHDGYRTLIPYLRDMRTMGRLLALKARLQIADQKFDDAAHTLQTGFALCYHLNQDALLIQELVAAGVSAMMLEQVNLWISTPGSPNLYWPLTDLPQPMNDLRTALAQERAMGYYSIPHLREALAGKITAEGVNEMIASITGMKGNEGKPDLTTAITNSARIMALGPTAKLWLSTRGYTAGQLDAMQNPQLVGLYLARGYDEATEEFFKWKDVPYWQAAKGLAEIEREIKTDQANVLVSVLLPSLRQATASTLQPQRRVDALRTLEAIRDYAANHDGKAPATLADLKDLPLPTDVSTGSPFIYQLSTKGFILDAPLTLPVRSSYGQHYEVTLQN